MTFRQAAYLVASDEVARAKDWEYALWSNPKVPRPAVYKAKLEVHAAKMRAARILSTHHTQLPDVFRVAIEAKLKVMKPGDRVQVRNWKAHGWEGRSGIVIRTEQKYILVRFSDWSPTDVKWPIEDASALHVIA